jgi:hypothetical protein
MSQKVVRRNASTAAASHEPAFREITGLIAAARRRAFQAVNTELIDFYWRVGSQKVSPVVRQISRRSKVAALLRQIQPIAKTLGTGERIEMDDRPHPGPLPQERENRSPSLGTTSALRNSSAPRREEARRGDSQFESRITRIDLCLFPLLGGEGKGEGGREHHFLFCLP